MRSHLALTIVALPLAAATVFLATRAASGEGGDGSGRDTSVKAADVVVHGVDTGALAARLSAIDKNLDAGHSDRAAAELDALLGDDLSGLVEEPTGMYLWAEDATLYRIAGLSAEALAEWRALADDRAASLLADAAESGSRASLELSARRHMLTSSGPQLVVMLADLRLRDGDIRGAAAALEELLTLWPEGGAAGPMPGIDRAAIVSRLAGLAESLEDGGTVRGLLDRSSDAVLGAPSRLGGDRTVRDELAAAVARLEKRPAAGPSGTLEIVAEAQTQSWDLALPLPSKGREILDVPMPYELADGSPALLTRVSQAFETYARLVAVKPSAKAPAPGKHPGMDVVWTWPSAEELSQFPRWSGDVPFEPVRYGDAVIMCWPSTRQLPTDGERHLDADESAQDLVALSLSAEGRLFDERGVGEDVREDGDPGLAKLSFCGPPLLVDDRCYVTLVGRSANGGATELHVARFDIVRRGEELRLVLRWRRHVVDGSPVPPSRYAQSRLREVERRLAFPTGLVERFGRIYVGSNTGAVACLDGDDGHVAWIETYERLGPSARQTVHEAEPRGWKYGPAMADGDRLVIAPRDSEELLLYAARPLLSRSTRLGAIAVRGSGTHLRAGSPLGDLMVDEVVGVRDGLVFLSGDLPEVAPGTIRWPPSPLVAYRLRDRREGEPAGRLRVPQIAELSSAGAPLLTGDSILFPTYKALYRVPLADFEAAPSDLWRGTTNARAIRMPDRLGNIAASGRHVWSLSNSRIVLFRVAAD